MTIEEMIDKLIEHTYDGLDYKDLFDYVHYYELKNYADWTDEEIEAEYKERFEDEQES